MVRAQGAAARAAAPAGGLLPLRLRNCPLRATATVGWDGVNYRRIKQIYHGHDRNAAIDVARRHAGEFPLVEVWANGE